MEFKIQNKTIGAVLIKISDEDADLAIRPWHLAGGKLRKGEPGMYVAGRDGILLHRIVAHRMGLLDSIEPVKGLNGKWSVSVDHINGDKLDNRRKNLRLRDRRKQMTNSNDGLRVNNSSGARGVSFVASRERFGKPWRATATDNRRSVTLGMFATATEAAAVRRSFDAADDKTAWLKDRRSRADTASGYKGVHEADGRFYANTVENGQTVSLGGYDTVEEAAKARESYLATEDKAVWLERLRSRPQSNGSSGYRGVSLLKQVRERRWQAYATKNKKRVNLGRYDTAEEAAAARKAWEQEQSSANG